MANPKKELLEWLALKPRTQGWGAVVAYDRQKCNTLLLQDYINKSTTDSYLPPIDKPVPTGNANWEHLSDWVQDAPRIFFENSSNTAGGEVNLRMAIIGGTQVSIDNVLGHKRAIAVKSLDALDYPELICEDVALSKTNGTVGKDTGEVVLDLGDPETAKGNWELTFANTQHERRIGGQFFKRYYQNADKEKRIYHPGKALRGTDGKNTYTAPVTDDNIEGSFENDEIEVKNLATGKIQRSYVVVNHFPNDLTVTIDMSQSSLPEGKAKFKALRRATEEKDANWEVAEGSGHIDANGFYTADPAGQHRFALITARTEIDGVIDRNGWCITPLPLVELPDKPPDDVLFFLLNLKFKPVDQMQLCIGSNNP